MENIKNDSCCCSSGNCCSEGQNKVLKIDFLYLDLSICQRCQNTGNNLDEALKEVSTVLKSAGYDVVLNKINITSPEMAKQHKFLSSPTIRINNNDIDVSITETLCEDCGELCGDEVDCRTWNYEGVQYNEPPKAMIINKIMQTIYGGKSEPTKDTGEYVLPENLRVYFDGASKKNI